MHGKITQAMSAYPPFRALKHRNYALFFFGQGVSLIGTWMQRITIGWLVYRLTNSALMLGTVSFASQIPILVLSPIAGVLADRLSKHKLLVITQSLAMLQAAILAVLVLTEQVQVWQIIALGTCLGIINSFDMPVRQSFIIDMIEEKEDLANAIALNSSLVNGGKLLGPSVAGILIVFLGEGMCFLLNALSYVAVIFALLSMTVQAKKAARPAQKIWTELREGYQYAVTSGTIRSVLLLVALVSFVGMPYISLMPMFAGGILEGGPDTLAYLMFANGVGSLIASVFLTTCATNDKLSRLLIFASFTLGGGLILFSVSKLFWLSLVVITAVGFGMMLQSVCSNTILQTIVDDSKRGRLMSFYTMANMGTTPFGNLFTGFFANSLGVGPTVLFCGICCIIGAIAYALHAKAPKSSKDEDEWEQQGCVNCKADH
ncbi:MAG TPA: MFS transporter [Firmicutes bacterium]|nr:MFS transporter [Bacillota bacterium]